MRDFLDEKIDEIQERMQELEPIVDEYERLTVVLRVFDAPIEDIKLCYNQKRVSSFQEPIIVLWEEP